MFYTFYVYICFLLVHVGINSAMLQNSPFYQDTLNNWLAEEGLGNVYWVPCFRTNADGWNASIFQSQCALKAATVVIIRKRDCFFGGFADKPWSGKLKPCHCVSSTPELAKRFCVIVIFVF